MTKPLTAAQIKKALANLPNWKHVDDVLEAEFTFKDFRRALAFMVQVGFEAEAMNHHPDWANVYNQVLVRLSTHDAGGKVTAKDVELAQRIEKIRA
jgi:4a-hydroxytetrahydrobiopterin dehydratase